MIFCNNCGEKNDDFATFCKKCGGPVVISSGRLKTGMTLDNRYKIKRLIKSGGMGAVYEAHDQRFSNSPCALKEMLGDSSDQEDQDYMVKRFKKEAEMLHSLRHQNLPVVKDYFVEGGRYYLVMDYIEGQDLETIMKSYGEGGVPEDLVVIWAIQILDALDYLHSQATPIIYRDLKPSNIMLRNSDKRIILVDFGIARPVATGSMTSKTIVGTPAFAPEEIFQGSPEPRSDIYSLGATMHSLLTGIIPKHAFSFGPIKEIRPDLSMEIENIITRALARKPAERYESARVMRKAMETLAIDPLEIELSYPTRITPKDRPGSPSQNFGREYSQESISIPEERPLDIKGTAEVPGPPSKIPSPSKEIKKISKEEFTHLEEEGIEKKPSSNKTLIIVVTIISFLVLGGCSFMIFLLWISSCLQNM